MGTSLKQTPRLSACLSLLLLVASQQDGHLSKTDIYSAGPKAVHVERELIVLHYNIILHTFP